MSEQLSKFLDDGYRPFATQAITLIESLRHLVGSYYVPGSPKAEVDAQVAIDSTAIVEGSDSDGRPPLTYGGVALSMANCAAMLDQMDAVPDGQALSFLEGLMATSPRYAG